MLHPLWPTAHDWGIIHPVTGILISGVQHQTAVSHPDLRAAQPRQPNVARCNFSDYVLYRHQELGVTLLLRSFGPKAHQGILNGFDNLPLADHYQHDGRGKMGFYFKVASSPQELRHYIQGLI